MDMTERDDVGISNGDDNCEYETIKRSFSKNSNRAVKYLTPKARLAFTQLKKKFTKASIYTIGKDLS